MFLTACFKKGKYGFANIVYYKTIANCAPLKIIVRMKIKSNTRKVDFSR